MHPVEPPTPRHGNGSSLLQLPISISSHFTGFNKHSRKRYLPPKMPKPPFSKSCLLLPPPSTTLSRPSKRMLSSHTICRVVEDEMKDSKLACLSFPFLSLPTYVGIPDLTVLHVGIEAHVVGDCDEYFWLLCVCVCVCGDGIGGGDGGDGGRREGKGGRGGQGEMGV